MPGTQEKECGNYKDHSLVGAKEWAKEILKQGISSDPFERKIVGVPKDTVFNVNDFKGYYSPTQKNKLLLYIDVIYKKIIQNNMPFLYFIRDKIFNKKPAK